MSDILIDVNVTPNRADCLSHLGLAREISALFKRPLRTPEIKQNFTSLIERWKQEEQQIYSSNETQKQKSSKKENSPVTKKKTSLSDKELRKNKPLPLEIKDSKACPRYCGQLIEEVTVAPSPLPLQRCLERLGLKSINNIVDITNFILMDVGQPLHAFDRDQISSISVDSSKKGEKFISLEDKELTLTGEELTIRDKKGVLALAGVIGGRDSAISNETINIFVESACFRPESVRHTARRFGLQTDSSYRFSRGTDPEGVLSAMNKACLMIQKLTGGKINSKPCDKYPQPYKPKHISISLSEIKSRLGMEINSEEFKSYLTHLKCEISSLKSSQNSEEKNLPKTSQSRENTTSALQFKVTPPSFRVDLSIKEDLMEELARLKGYEHIPSTPARPMKSIGENLSSTFSREMTFSQKLKSHGWRQMINYSFSDPNFYADFMKDQLKFSKTGLFFEETFSVSNPISSRLSLMKPLLLPDVFKAVAGNVRNNNKEGRLFEIAPVFYKEGKSYKEIPHFSLACWGQPLNFRSPAAIPNVFHLKSAMEFLLKSFRWKGWTWETLSDPPSFFHPSQTLFLQVQGRRLGLIGSIHPSFALKHKMSVPMAFGEFNGEELWKCSKSPVKFKPFSELSPVERDLCFVIPPSIPAGEVQQSIRKALGKTGQEVTVFDIYEQEGQRSVSFRMFLTPDERPWTDKELEAIQNKVIQHITRHFPSIRLK
ncbi:MAG: phenylalanine--tRNA ligase subunit beta [Bdellovibrionales bacterium]|nr:phenylalanine--tRNA ligase subunit beta [Bdellovibrionales bacterium]